jgi:hypothetical protein
MFQEPKTEGDFDTGETGARDGVQSIVAGKRIGCGAASTSPLSRSRTTGKAVWCRKSVGKWRLTSSDPPDQRPTEARLKLD